MKLKEIKIGQVVIDRHGNEYTVDEVDKDESRDNIMPIRITCTKFLKNAIVQQNDISFYKVGQSFWIFKSEKVAKHDHMYIEDCITVKSLKMKG